MMDTSSRDSDCDSFSESGSSEDHEGNNMMYGGQACSILSSLEQSISKIDDFLSFERGFLHGDIVCSVSDPSGQMGKVIDVNMLVDLENLFGEIFKDINSSKLQKIRSISEGDYVAFGPWLGRVDQVVDRVTVLYDDGSKCEVTTMDQEKLLPVSADLVDDSQYPYYPGQRVRRVRQSAITRSTRWFCGSEKENCNEGTISAVEVGLVHVDWVACAPFDGDLSMPSPSRLQDAKNVTLLSCFLHANWQLGDWCMLSNSKRCARIEQITDDLATFEPTKGRQNVGTKFKCKEFDSNTDQVFVIAKTKTKINVLWQDGSSSLGLDSASLIPVTVVNTHEFWPGQFVLEKSACDDSSLDSSSRRWGVVVSMDAKERIVKVNWYSFSDGVMVEETVSAYELIEHPDYSFSLGDMVFRSVQKRPFCETNKLTGPWSIEAAIGTESAVGDKNLGRDYRQYNCFLFSVGNVIGFQDGCVEVKWATGLTTKVAPYEIIGVDECEGSTRTAVIPEDNDKDVDGFNGQSTLHTRKDSFDYNPVEEDCEQYSCGASSSSLSQAAIGFLSSIASSLFGSLGSSFVSGSTTSGNILENESKLGTCQKNGMLELFHETQPKVDCVLQALTGISSTQHFENVEQKEILPVPSGNNIQELFRQFDMVDDCSDHHFVDTASRGLPTYQIKREWLKRVQQEWSILEKNLPETIYVRVFEERMDLLRATIVGSPGTPYHDGLFIFDIYLPPDYPNEPPLVHYHSGGLRINPNLYESGKVCLSLLNTWTGTGTEVWTSGSSTILQVLLSIQALVLNEKPYFNEAGFDKQMGQTEGEKNSASYNENAFLLNCKSMLYLIRRPPKHFEALVQEHFGRRYQHILTSCQAYMEGSRIGSIPGYKDAEENQQGSSTGFKIMLGKLLPKLVEAFSEKGIDCSQFIGQNI